MGVHGITSLLQKEGWVPSPSDNNDNKTEGSSSSPSSSSCSSVNLFQEWNPSIAFMNNQGGFPLHQIVSQSSFLIDGNGLAFYLFKVAYAKHLRSIFNKSRHQRCCPGVNEVDTKDIVKALPCMLPLHLLEELANEYISQLRLYNIKMRIYWDGPCRRFKTVTEKKRRQQRQQQWSNLQQYCIHGSLPNEKDLYRFLNHFPFPSIFLRCIKTALQRIEQVDMVDCTEEADIELAHRASGDPTAYVLGQDSDFFFYKDIQYIPFDCIFTSQTSIHACVATRSGLAQLLGLDEEEQMIDFAILLGNDYVQNIKIPKKKNVPKINRDPISIARYLQQQGDDFQVQPNKAQHEAISFVRALYDLEDLDSFPLQDNSNLTHDSSTKDNEDEDDFMDILQVSLPESTAMQQAATITLEDSNVTDAIQRCLLTCMQQTEGDGNSSVPLQEQHFAAYIQMISSPNNNNDPSMPTQMEARPRWNDIRAAYVIETCISRVLKSSKDSLLVRLARPSRLFDHYKFHSILSSLHVDLSDNELLEAENDSGLDVEDEEEPTFVDRKRLPIDDHEESILRNIQNNRVTIIHGETGCGKSSRVPIMLLQAPSPEPTLSEVKFFIAQPRRIAAKGLVERIRSCEPNHRDQFALRMGHGWVEYETKKTQAWFVTTGYLTRLLANHPDRFDECTHLIIDEVHERSVDTDILCLLCRRLLDTNKKIRLVLMSATLATKLYKEYFAVPNDPIHVGVRTFPIKEYFVEDLVQQFKLPPNECKAALAIQKECEQKRCNTAPSASELSKRFSLAARLAKIVGRPGSSVLIFVPGMNEIVAITECIDNLHVAGIRYTTCPIHSDIPFEDQMDAFNEPEEDEVKIVIATNAAESSVTLPTVDHVICLGLCRQIVYNPTSHRQMLSPCWISRASAKQRAGRTGRVRPGNVYRLYTRNAFESFMEEFDPGEIKRIPLDAIILMLKQMLHEEVVPVLQSCIEPPQLDTIGRSFESLHRSNFLVGPNDQAEITSLGSFVSSLGIDLALGSFVGLGIQFGVAAEAIEMAAIMSFPKSPFQMTSPLFHDPATFNEITSEAYVSRCHFDANLYSEPLALMNALWDYDVAPSKIKWCLYYRFAIARMRQLVATRNSLRKRVADYFGINEDILMPECPPVHMAHAKIVILRLLKVWVFSDTIVESWPSNNHLESNGSLSLSLQKGKKQKIERRHLDQVLIPERHSYEIQTISDLEQSGNFEYQGAFELAQFIPAFEMKLVSYMVETRIDTVCVYDQENFFLYINEEKSHGDIVGIILNCVRGVASECLLLAYSDPNMKRRGLLERKCGTWSIQVAYDGALKHPSQKKCRKIHVLQRHQIDFTSLCLLMDDALNAGEVSSVMFWEFPQAKGQKKKKKKKKQAADASDQSFSIIARGECQAISKLDLQDLLGASEIHSIVRGDNKTKIRFLAVPNQPFPYDVTGKNLFATSNVSEGSSWKRPLFQDIPEGAKLLCVLVSSQRRGGQRIRFDKGNDNGDPEDTLDITLDKGQTDITRRWERLGTEGPVFVPENTVPASATNTTSPLFAACSNALDIKGGMLKVEGMTLLPPDPLFVLLGFVSFGLQPNVAFTWGQMEQGYDNEDQDASEQKKLRNAISWLNERKQKMSEKGGASSDHGLNHIDAKKRVRMAIAFHNSCSDMGETLHCFPEKIQSLCALFTLVDGYEVFPWDSITETAFTPANLVKWRREKRTTHKTSKTNGNGTMKMTKAAKNGTKASSKSVTSAPVPNDVALTQQPVPAQVTRKSATQSNSANMTNTKAAKNGTKASSNSGTGESVPKATTQVARAQPKTTQVATKTAAQSSYGANQSQPDKTVPTGDESKKNEKLQIIRTFPDSAMRESSKWFATTQTEKIGANDFPSTNILALLFQMYNDEVLGGNISHAKTSKSIVALNAENWEIFSYTNNNRGRVSYQALFINDLIPILPIVGRGKNKLPKWMKKHNRPNSIALARSCMPPGIQLPKLSLFHLSKDRPVLMFDSIAAAVQMEAAFWLERQFCFAQKSSTRHWYQHDLQEMIQLLKRHEAANSKMHASSD